ncbi:MAG: tyrosine-type recombinase/integrase [Flavobacteriales bacterium]
MIASFLEFLQVEKNYSEHTRKAYQADLEQCRQFLEFELDQNQLEKTDHKSLRYWVVALSKQNLHPKSINRKIASLKSYFNFLMLIEEIDQNPAEGLKSLKTPKRLAEFYNNTEIDEVLQSFDLSSEEFHVHRDFLLLYILCVTGIRRSELINLRLEHLDLANQSLDVLGKGGKWRKVYLPDEGLVYISNYLKIRKKNMSLDCNYLFLTNNYKKLYPKFVYRKVNDYFSNVSKGRKKSPHVLRHSLATALMNNTVGLNTIKDVLGHSSLSSTAIYTHNTKVRMTKAYQSHHPRGDKKQ